MFKLVVLSAIFAAAAAKPGAAIFNPFAAPIAYSTVISPGTTTITKQASSVVHPSPPLVYSAPFAYTHFIKKRSAPLAYYSAPTTYIANTHLAAAPLATTYSAPALIHSGPILPAAHLPYAATYATHLIKKRSAPLLPTTYITPTTYSYAAAAPLLTSTYTATPLVHSTSLISHPITYSTHFIKKRSAPLFNTYLAPTSYSHQSRVDLQSSPLVSTTYTSPLTYSSPIAYTHLY